MSAEAFQNIKENIELIPDEKKADEALYKKRLEICTECDCLIMVCAVSAVVLWR